MSKLLPILSAVCTLSLPIFSYAQKEEVAPVTPVKTEHSSNSFFPIMAWDWNYDNFNFFAKNPHKRDEQLRMMKECGINIAGIFKLEDTAMIERAGMRSLVLDPRLTYNWVGWLKGEKLEINKAEANRKVKSLVDEIKQMPGNGSGIYGYYLVDEPGSEVLQPVATISKLLQEHDPSRPIYINLHPNYAPGAYISGGDYAKYLAEFAAMKPNLISVDNYYLMRPDEWLNPGLAAMFYKNMEQMRNLSLELNVPFWSVVLSMPHQAYVNVTYANLARQVYVSLAYGAKGISYFCYFLNNSPDASTGPIDRDGNKTPIWDCLHDVNHEILALAPTLNQLTPQRNYFLGSVPEGSDAAPADAPVKATAVTSLLVGEFRHAEGGRYIMLVNTNLKTAVPANSIQISAAIEEVSAKDGSLAPIKTDEITIAPGHGILLKLVD